MKGFQPFQDFIIRAANHYGIGTELNAAKICHDFKTILPEIFDGRPQISNFIEPAYYKNHELVINVESSAWAQEVIMRKPKIIEEMNRKAGKEIIKNLRTQLKDSPSPQSP